MIVVCDDPRIVMILHHDGEMEPFPLSGKYEAKADDRFISLSGGNVTLRVEYER